MAIWLTKDSRVIVTAANGTYALASYKPDPDRGYIPWAVHVLEISGDRVVGHHSFIGEQNFELFGLPVHPS